MLVREFLQNSSLKVLPANQFEDAVIRFIEKGGKETVDEFINETLTKSLDYLVKIDDTKLDRDMDAAMEQCKERLEKRWAQAGGKWVPRRKLKPKPEGWDSDMEGPWDDPKIDDRWEIIAQPGRDGQNPGDGDVDMDDSMSGGDTPMPEESVKPAPRRGAAAKGGRGGAVKKVAATKTGGGRPKKKGGFVVDSDEDDEEEAQDMAMSEDDFIDDEEEDDLPPPPPKRASRATKATPATKTTASRATSSRAAKPPASKAKQTTLNFSQSQRPSRSAAKQKTLTISDDEIDDDDDDDAFEPVQTTRSKRR